MTSSLGKRLNSERRKHDLTIDALASKSGVSRSMISKVERGEAQPTTSVLGKLAEALDLSISQLVGGPQVTGTLLVRQDDQPRFSEERSGFERRSLSPLYRGRGIDLVLNTLPPKARTGPFPSHRAGVEEHLWVQSGNLIVEVGDEQHNLNAGDFLFYPADRDHSFVNEGDTPAIFMIAIDSTKLR
jgi:transcriptional regulator with XRE-family HTH domain